MTSCFHVNCRMVFMRHADYPPALSHHYKCLAFNMLTSHFTYAFVANTHVFCDKTQLPYCFYSLYGFQFIFLFELFCIFEASSKHTLTNERYDI